MEHSHAGHEVVVVTEVVVVGADVVTVVVDVGQGGQVASTIGHSASSRIGQGPAFLMGQSLKIRAVRSSTVGRTLSPSRHPWSETHRCRSLQQVLHCADAEVTPPQRIRNRTQF